MATQTVDELLTEQRRLKAEWDRAFAALRAAGVEYDSSDPVAVTYRAASKAVNHVNRKLDFHVASGATR